MTHFSRPVKMQARGILVSEIAGIQEAVARNVLAVAAGSLT